MNRSFKDALHVRIDTVAAGGAVKRYHALFTLIPQTVAEHSFGVSWWCLLLTDMQASRDLIIHALGHDLAEARVGDIPSPVKRELEIGGQVQAMEDAYLQENAMGLPTLDEYDTLVLKLADCMDGIAFCRREVSLGNVRLQRTLERYISYVLSIQPPPGVAANVHAALAYLTPPPHIGDAYDSK